MVVDEADTLLSKDFAIQTMDVIKKVENNLDSLVFVAATITKPVQSFITTNFPVFDIFNFRI